MMGGLIMSNLSQEKRKEMLEYINKLKEIHKDDESIIALEKIETALTEKKYGLVWEEHEEEVDKKLVHNIPVFTEVEDRKIIADENEGFNFLLEGDNLHSLKLLEKTHKGKIDVIYIDPPYNLGKDDFQYNDRFVGEDDGFKHSKWLSFISERLNLAYKLLSETGFIAISIDETEYAPLKLLCDDIFGEENRLITFHIQVRYDNKNLNEKNDWQPVMEYVLFYSKQSNKMLANKPYDDYNLDKFTWEIIEKTDGFETEIGGKRVKIFKENEYSIVKSSETGIGKLKETWASGSVLTGNASGKYFDQYLSNRKQIDGLKVLYKVEGIGEDGLGYRYFTGPKKENASRGKFYSGVPLVRVEELNNGKSLKYRPITNYYNFSADFGNIRHEGGVSFNNGKKPTKLIKQLINYCKNKNATILDFFAGSGTTGHAVIQLNKEDGGKRKYILCTNNENKICEEVTYKRLQNIQEELPHNLKYFKTDFTPKFTEEEDILSFRLLDHIKEMVELENMCEIDGVNRVIVLTDEELNEKLEIIKEGAYLYIPAYILLTNETKKIFEEKKLNLVEIPEYYFMDELREAKEI